VSLEHLWPLVSVFAGISLFPAGWHRYRRLRASYFVSCLAFIVLGCFVLVFSLELAPFSVRQFIFDWWPLIMVSSGLLLLLVSLAQTNVRD
jgi:hypothetical protein